MKVRERIRRTWKKKGFRYGAAGTLCLMLATVMLVLSFGSGARAAGTIGELNDAGGTISSASEFELLRNASSVETEGNTYTLTRDITISSVTSAATGTFAGTFNGGGHVITIEDINITDRTAGAVNQGVLFGMVTGTVENLIVDVTDTDPTYTRISDAGVTQQGNSVTSVVSDGSAEYTPRTPISELNTEAVDSAAYNEIKTYTPVYLDESNKEVPASTPGASAYVKTVKEKKVETVTSYEANNPDEDGFGIICGKLTGSVSQISVNGKTITVNQTVAESGKATKTDSETTPYTHYYEVGTTDKIEASDFTGTSVSLEKPTVYSETVTAPGSNAAVGEVMSLRVTAPAKILSGENLTYTITVRALGDVLSSVTLTAPENGTWTVDGNTSAGETLNLSNLNTNEKTILFQPSIQPSTEVSEFSKTADFHMRSEVNGQSVKATAGVTTTVLLNASDTESASNAGVNASTLELSVTAPKAYVANAGDSITINYKVEVKNNDGTAPLSNVTVQAPNGMTLTSGATSVGTLAANGTSTLEFTKTFAAESGEQQAIFSASADVGTPEQKISATATATTTGYLTGTAQEETAVIRGDRVKITASVADKAVYTGSGFKLVYKVRVENTSGVVLTGIQVAPSSAAVGGSWSKISGSGSVSTAGIIDSLDVDASMVLEYRLPIAMSDDIDFVERNAAFTISEGSESSTTGNLSTMVYNGKDIAVIGTGTGQSKDLQITVSAPKAFLINADGTATLSYQVTVKNKDSSEYTNVTVTIADEQNATIGTLDFETLGSEESKTLDFNRNLSNIFDGRAVFAKFQVAATSSANTLNASATITSTGYKPGADRTVATAIQENKVTLTASVPDKMAYTGDSSTGTSPELVYAVNVTNDTGAELTDIQILSSASGGTWSVVGDSTVFDASTGKISSLSASGSLDLQYRLPIRSIPSGGSQQTSFTMKKGSVSQSTSGLTTEVYDVTNSTYNGSSSAIDPEKLTVTASAPVHVKRTSGGTEITYTLSVKVPDGKEATITAPTEGTWGGEVSGTGASVSITGTGNEQTVTFVRTVAETDAASTVTTSFSAQTTDGIRAVETAALTTNLFETGTVDSGEKKNTPVTGGQLNLHASAPAVAETAYDTVSGKGTAEVLYKINVTGSSVNSVPGTVLYALSGEGVSVRGKWGVTEAAARSASESDSFTVPEGCTTVYYLAEEVVDLVTPPASVKRSFLATKSENYFGITIPVYYSKTSVLDTKVYRTDDQVNTAASAADGKIAITLTGDTRYVSTGTNGKKITYTLQLENKDSARPVHISMNLSGWTLTSGSWSSESYKTTGQSPVTYGAQVLAPGSSVSLQKICTAGQIAGNMSVTVAGQVITITPVTTYVYSGKVEGTSSASTEYGSSLYAGNHLRAGIVAGIGSGTVEKLRQDMDITGVSASQSHNQVGLSVGGVIGKMDSSVTMKDLYVNGAVEAPRQADVGWIIGTGGAAATVNSSVVSGTTDASKLGVAGTNVKLGDAEPDIGNSTWSGWKRFRYDSDADTAHTSFDLEWLVKNGTNVFTYMNPTGTSKAISIKVGSPVTGKELQYRTVYHARKTLTDEENQSYFSDTSSLDLGDSGYWQKVHTYATDGYYHYEQDYGTGTSGDIYVTEYPYRTTGKPVFTDSDPVWSVERVTGTLTDQIKLKLADLIGIVRIYYQGGTKEAEIENDKAVFPFEHSPMNLTVVPTLDGKIYEEIVRDRTFTAADRAALPKPEVYGDNYHEANGSLKEESFSAGASYPKGSELKIRGTEEMGNCSYAYCISQAAPNSSIVETDGRITDAGGLQGIAWTAYEGTIKLSDTVPDTYYYLYVKVSAENYPDTVYYYGSLKVDALATSSLQLYYDYNGTTGTGTPVTGDVITEGDTLVFQVTPSGRLTKLQYVISGVRLEGNTLYGAKWENYTGAVRMKHPTNGDGCYIYTRMTDASESVYGAVASNDKYTFAKKSGSVQISPRTVAAESEADASAASVIPSGSVIYLDSAESGSNSATSKARILYLVNSSVENVIKVSRMSGDVGNPTEDGQHFKVGNRWYQTEQEGVKVFADKIQLYNETNISNIQYIHTVVLGADLEPSEAISYAYQVEPTKQAAVPEATLATQSFPGGADVPMAEVEKDSVLSFSTLTPGGELYYIIGNGEVSDREGVGETRKYDSSKGIQVEGDYGSQFIISMKTVKWNADRTKKEMKDSDTIRFVYSIAEQGQALSPTATPETSRENPITVIPGDKILLSTATKGASIFYTTDGTMPQAKYVNDSEEGHWEAENESTALYDAGQGITMPLEGSGYFTIRAIAVKTDLANSPEVQFSYAFPDTVQSPYTNIPSGAVDLGAQILLKNRTQGASIHYTVAYDGKTPDDPTVSSAVFDEGQPIIIQRETTIKALAVKDGVKSEIVTFRFLSMNQLSTPTASIDSGAMVSRGTKLKLSASEGAAIYYTMDGSDPTDTGNAAVIEGKEITLDGAAGAKITIKAYARAEGKSDSDVVTFTYQISQSASGVTADVANGTLVSNGTKVNLMTDVTGAKIYYTTDGSDPVAYGKEGSVVTVSGTAGGTFTIKAVAVVDGEAGGISTFTYKIKEKPTIPSASPAGGMLTIATRVELSSSVEKIYYTTDGTTPTESSSLYKEPILINRTTNLQAIAVSEDGEVSDVASYQYTAAQKAKAPTASHEDGSVLEPGTIVRLHTDTESSRIYYSTNGTDPTLDNLENMQLYTEDGIAVYRTVTIKAVSYREDMQLSAVGSYTYRVDTIPAVEMKAQEAARLAEEELHDTDASDLEREEDYDGTAYQSRILQEKTCNTVVSSAWNTIPSDAVLITEEKEYSSRALENVKKVFGDDYVILNSYDIILMRGHTIIQPDGEVELGMPIPEKYKNAAVTIVYIDSDQKVTRLDTRRKDGMAYAKVEHFSNYALVGLEEKSQTVQRFHYLLILEATAGVVLLLGIGYYIQRKWKKRKKTTRTSNES